MRLHDLLLHYSYIARFHKKQFNSRSHRECSRNIKFSSASLIAQRRLRKQIFTLVSCANKFSREAYVDKFILITFGER